MRRASSVVLSLTGLLALANPAFAAEWIVLAAPAASGAKADAARGVLEKTCKNLAFWLGSANLIGGKANRFIVYAGPFPTKAEAVGALSAVKRCAPKAKVVSADFSEPM